MSANLTYHFNKLLNLVDETLQDTPDRDQVRMLIKAASFAAGKAERKPETDFSNETPLGTVEVFKSVTALGAHYVAGRGWVVKIDYQEGRDLNIKRGEKILIDGSLYYVTDIEMRGESPIHLIVRTAE